MRGTITVVAVVKGRPLCLSDGRWPSPKFDKVQGQETCLNDGIWMGKTSEMSACRRSNGELGRGVSDER